MGHAILTPGSCQDAAPSRVFIVVGPLRLPILLVAAALSLPATSLAAAQPVLPPENSGANQYTEALPGAGGNEPTSGIGGKGGATPEKVLGHRNAAKLEALGPDGSAAAQLAAAAAPNGVSAAGTGQRGVDTGESQGTEPASPDGTSGLGQVLGQISGFSGSGGMGFLLPLVIIMGVIATAGFVLTRWRTAKMRN